MKKLLAVALSALTFFSFVPAATAQTATATELLSYLSVAPESNGSSYSRSLFRHWSDADRNGCNTREEVLLLESSIPITPGRGCRITRGKWFSEFDGRTFTSAASLDIDHFVPLKEAWDSGASGWNSRTREAFANDLGFAGSLIAVSASSNRSKSDRDPADWIPTRTAFRCNYAVTWVQVKYRWGLSADEREVAALRNLLGLCPAGESYSLPERAVDAPSPSPNPTVSPTPTETPSPSVSPSPTQSPAPSPTETAPASPSPTPTQAGTELPRITPGAFCAKDKEGTQGRASNGLVYTCKTSATDTRLRWRR